jgi:ABC-2 type transport system ATP-binding protein
MIDVVNVSKSYGPIRAVHQASFHVDPGEIIGLLGPNGSGKTTLLRILAGYLHPDEGTVTIDGLDVLADRLQVQERIGYLPENAPLYPELTTQEYLRMVADLRTIPNNEQPRYLSEAIRATGLENHLTRPIGELSKGYRQRVGLAQAIMHRPKVLILDEPTAGLDPTQIAEVRRLIRRLAGKSTVLLSTHVLSEVEATCERVIMLLNGEVRADARLEELAETGNVMLTLAPGAPDARSELKVLPGVEMVESHPTADGDEYWIRGAREVDLRPAVFELAREQSWPVKELKRDVRTLETVFDELATTASEAEPAREEVHV